MKKIVVIGPFPPPVHGMAKNLKLMFDSLKFEYEGVCALDISPGRLDRGLLYHFSKFKKFVIAWFKLFYMLLTNKVKSAYIPPDGGFGLVYTFSFVALISIFNRPLIMHHRSFAYINNRNIFMLFICAINNSSTHVFLCSCMAKKFQIMYGEVENYTVVSNATHVEIPKAFNISCNDVINVGFMSNIGYEKGIGRFIQLVEKLKENGIQLNAYIAGPFDSVEVESSVKELISNSHYISYLGPVYNEEKVKFFQSLDCFVFPTFYRNEAQPNVLFEAMSYGNFIVSTDIACIAEDFSSEFSIIHEANDEWVNIVAADLFILLNDKEKFLSKRKKSFEMLKTYKELSDESHNRLIKYILES